MSGYLSGITIANSTLTFRMCYGSTYSISFAQIKALFDTAKSKQATLAAILQQMASVLGEGFTPEDFAIDFDTSNGRVLDVSGR